MALFRKFFYRKPPEGLLELSEGVFVFNSCFTTDVLEEDEYKAYVGGVVAQLREYLPDASYMVFNFGEGNKPSQLFNILSEYDIIVMDYPRQYEGCPLLSMDMIHHVLRSSESWLSLSQRNVLLMHCERGGWPVLAFMLASLLIHTKMFTNEKKTLDMIYRQAPTELLQLLSPLNPLPSQLRYLQYVSRRNVGSEWPPLDRALALDCVILRNLPIFSGECGCRPIFRIYGPDPFDASDKTPKVLYSLTKKSKAVRFYKEADCELIKIGIHCHVQGDVVLECINVGNDLEREQMMFRLMFNTAFIRSNILILNNDEIDIIWNARDNFSNEFRAEILLSEMDADTSSVVITDLDVYEDKEGLSADAFSNAHEIFSNVDWLETKEDTIHQAVGQMTSSNSSQEILDKASKQKPQFNDLTLDSSSNICEVNEKISSLKNNAEMFSPSIVKQQCFPSAKENPIAKGAKQSSIPQQGLQVSSQCEIQTLKRSKKNKGSHSMPSGNLDKTCSQESFPLLVSAEDVKQMGSVGELSRVSSLLSAVPVSKNLSDSTISNASASCLPQFCPASPTASNYTVSSSPTHPLTPPSPLPPLSSTAQAPHDPQLLKSRDPMVPNSMVTKVISNPPPPQPFVSLSASCSISIQNKKINDTRTPPSPPPPPPSYSVSIRPFKASSAPPPPPPPLTSSATGHLSAHTKKPDSKSKYPPPPPPPLCAGPTQPPNASSPPPPPPNTKGRGPPRNSFSSQQTHKRTSLKPLHWVKVTRAMQGSLWAEPQKKAPEFDLSELENLFSATVSSKDGGGSGEKSGRRASLAQKTDKVNLIDIRRANNCGIVLNKIKMPLPDLMSSVLSLDDSILDADQVDNLIKSCPTREEMELLRGFKGNKESLGKCEQFFLEVMKVPRMESKLRVFSFKIHFRSQVDDLSKNLCIVNSAAEEIRNSTKLKRIMQAILSLGNALNQGTSRGSAVGFRLDSLLKLTDIRAHNNRMTLMHYLCKVIADTMPELLDFPKDLVNLEKASKVQLKTLAEEMQAISKGLGKVEEELTSSRNDGPVSQIFYKTLKEFIVSAEAEVRSLTSLYSGAGRNADALAHYFGEDPARCPFEQVVSTLNNFVRLFTQAHEENIKRIELERKKVQKDAENKMGKSDSPKKEQENISRQLQSSLLRCRTSKVSGT